jgi:hypothetical protein
MKGFCSLLVYAPVLPTRVLDTACPLLCEFVTVLYRLLLLSKYQRLLGVAQEDRGQSQ